MNDLVRLVAELASTPSAVERAAVLERYLRAASRDDAACAVAYFLGRGLPRAATAAEVRRWAREAAGLPDWMLAECRRAAGGLAEALALALPEPVGASGGGGGIGGVPLGRVVRELVAPLVGQPEPRRRAAVEAAWRAEAGLGGAERLVFNRLLTGGAGRAESAAARRLCARALAALVPGGGVSPPEMEHRLMSAWPDKWRPARSSAPSSLSAALEAVLSPGTRVDGPASAAGSAPWPRARLLEAEPDAAGAEAIGAAMGPPADWLAGWSWDGLPARLHAAPIGGAGGLPCDGPALWAERHGVLDDRFPELAALGRAGALPPGTVLEGEVVPWDPVREAALPWTALRQRTRRTDTGARLFYEPPAVFFATDLLWLAGEDARPWPAGRRRAALESLVNPPPAEPGGLLRLTPGVGAGPAGSWALLAEARDAARSIGAQGLLLVPRRSAHPSLSAAADEPASRAGWRLWRAPPWSVEAVLVGVRRAGGEVHLALALWGEGSVRQLRHVATAPAGPTVEEAARVLEWSRLHAVPRADRSAAARGWRAVEPALVAELRFDAVAPSDALPPSSGRSRRGGEQAGSGYSLRRPRVARWLPGRCADDAGCLADLRQILGRLGAGPGGPGGPGGRR